MAQRAVLTPRAHRRGFLRSRAFAGYALVAPALLLTIAIMLYPLAFSFVTSFQRFQLARPNETGFVGLENYVWTITAPNFLNSLLVTTVFTVSAVTLEFLLGLG